MIIVCGSENYHKQAFVAIVERVVMISMTKKNCFRVMFCVSLFRDENSGKWPL